MALEAVLVDRVPDRMDILLAREILCRIVETANHLQASDARYAGMPKLEPHTCKQGLQGLHRSEGSGLAFAEASAGLLDASLAVLEGAMRCAAERV